MPKRKKDLEYSQLQQQTAKDRYSQEQLSRNFASLLTAANYREQAETVSTKIGALKFNANEINRIGIDNLVYFLSNDLTITTYSFNLTGLKKAQLSQLSKGFVHNTKMKDLTLDIRRLREDYLNEMAKAIASQGSLEKLKVECNMKSTQSKIIFYVANKCSLSKLDLSGCNVNTETLKELCSVLESSISLTYLDLSANVISDASAIHSLIKSKRTLLNVRLNGNKSLGTETILNDISNYLKKNLALVEELSSYLVHNFGEIKTQSIDINRDVRSKLKLYQAVDQEILLTNIKRMCNGDIKKSSSIIYKVDRFICENFFKITNVRKNYSDEFAILELFATSLFNVLEFLGRKSLWQIGEAKDGCKVFDDLEKFLMNDSLSEMNVPGIDSKAYGEFWSYIFDDI